MISKFCGEHDWIRNLAEDPETASNTSVCLSLDLEKDQVGLLSLLLSLPRLAVVQRWPSDGAEGGAQKAHGGGIGGARLAVETRGLVQEATTCNDAPVGVTA